MNRIIASTMLITLLAATPAHAAEPTAAATAANAATTTVVEAPTPALDAERPPSLDHARAPAFDDRRQEIERLRKRHRKALFAAIFTLGVGAAFVTAGGKLAEGTPGGYVSRAQLNGGLGLVGIGVTTALAAIIPAVIARRAKNRANRLESSLAWAPGGWVGRGTVGVGLSLRF